MSEEQIAPENDTIESFCQRERISKTTYYTLRRLGRGPKELRLGCVVRITPEARLAWRREQTELSNTSQQRKANATLRGKAVAAGRSQSPRKQWRRRAAR